MRRRMAFLIDFPVFRYFGDYLYDLSEFSFVHDYHASEILHEPDIFRSGSVPEGVF